MPRALTSIVGQSWPVYPPNDASLAAGLPRAQWPQPLRGAGLCPTSVDPLDPATWRGQVDAGDLAQGQGRLGLAVLRGLEAAHGR